MAEIKHYLIDMDGVLVRGAQLIPGANDFINRLQERGKRFLVLTNNSLYTQRDLQYRLNTIGLRIDADHIYTSALATAQFLHTQRPNASAYVIGEAGLTTALHDIGYVITEHNPDYVVLGETSSYSIERITVAMRLVAAGARFIATNPDVSGPSENGLVPACGAVAALISAATGVTPYFIGKPNPLIMRTALRTLEAHSEESAMVGDRMDTDIIVGTESGLRTYLVLIRHRQHLRTVIRM
jgi:NagD protein